MCNFVNPESLGSYSIFRNVFAQKIERAQEKGASKKEREDAAELSKEIHAVTSRFILRRTTDVLILPPKRSPFLEYICLELVHFFSLFSSFLYVYIYHSHLLKTPFFSDENIIFCLPSMIQTELYQRAVHLKAGEAFQSTARALLLISYLRCLCSHPGLVYLTQEEEDQRDMLSKKRKMLKTGDHISRPLFMGSKLGSNSLSLNRSLPALKSSPKPKLSKEQSRFTSATKDISQLTDKNLALDDGDYDPDLDNIHDDQSDSVNLLDDEDVEKVSRGHKKKKNTEDDDNGANIDEDANEHRYISLFRSTVKKEELAMFNSNTITYS